MSLRVTYNAQDVMGDTPNHILNTYLLSDHANEFKTGVGVINKDNFFMIEHKVC